MNKPKQVTLFQSWGSSLPPSQNAVNGNRKLPPPKRSKKSAVKAAAGKKTTPSLSFARPSQFSEASSDVIDLCEDSTDNNDADLLAAMEESLRCMRQGIGSNENQSSRADDSCQPGTSTDFKSRTVVSNCAENDDIKQDSTAKALVKNSLFQTTIETCSAKNEILRHNHGNDDVPNFQLWDDDEFTAPEIPGGTALEDLPGFDVDAGRVWVYPTNYPVRNYQYSIVEQVLFKNTMVTLPTGLGKTFIAAVVMFNFFRWYPTGKIVFMAPTKPLVAQQIEACHNIMGIPMEDTAEMTGKICVFS